MIDSRSIQPDDGQVWEYKPSGAHGIAVVSIWSPDEMFPRFIEVDLATGKGRHQRGDNCTEFAKRKKCDHTKAAEDVAYDHFFSADEDFDGTIRNGIKDRLYKALSSLPGSMEAWEAFTDFQLLIGRDWAEVVHNSYIAGKRPKVKSNAVEPERVESRVNLSVLKGIPVLSMPPFELATLN